MTDYKRLAYQSEDIFRLGVSLPVVAMRQLPKLAEKFHALPDHPEYKPGTQHAMAEGIMDFYREHLHLMDDERELREAFDKACKLHHYSHFMLALCLSV